MSWVKNYMFDLADRLGIDVSEVTDEMMQNDQEGIENARKVRLEAEMAVQSISIWMKQNKCFIDYEEAHAEKSCNSMQHKPPTYIVLKPGVHTYKCPVCGLETKLTITSNTL